MPVLRMPTDTTLGDTLGNLGRSLSENFNPLNTLRAYDIQQQMWMRQQQLLQMQRENAARQQAIDQWSHIVPPDKLPQIQLMIYQGAPYEQVARAAAQLSGNLKDDPAAMQDNIRYIESLTGKPYDYATLGPPVAGPLTAKQADDWKVSQAGRTKGAETSAQISAEQASRAPLAGMIDEATPAAALHNLQIYRTVYGKDPEGGMVDAGPVTAAANRATKAVQEGLVEQAKKQGGQQAIQALTNLYVDDTTPEAEKINRAVYSALNNGAQFEAGLPVPVGPKTNEAYRTTLAGKQETTAEAEARGKIFGGGVTAPTTIPTPAQVPPAASPTLRSAENANAPPAQTPPAQTPPTQTPPAQTPAPASNPAPPAIPPGATPDPNRPGWYWQGGQLKAPNISSTPAGTVIGVQQSDADVAKSSSDEAMKELTSAFAAGEGATKLLTITSQIRALEQVARTGGLVGQITAGPLRDILDKVGLENVTTAQQAQTTETSLLKNELPQIIKQANMTRVAQPEIAAVGTMTGTADLPPGVLNNILANADNAAQYTLKRKALAGQTLGYGGQMNYPEFQQQDTGLLNDFQNSADKLRTSYGAIKPQAATTPTTTVTNPPPPQTASGGNPVTDALAAVAHWFTGGSQAAPPAAPAAPSVELDATTGLPKGQ